MLEFLIYSQDQIKKTKIIAIKNIWLIMENNLEEARVYSAKVSGNLSGKKLDLMIIEELNKGKRILGIFEIKLVEIGWLGYGIKVRVKNYSQFSLA